MRRRKRGCLGKVLFSLFLLIVLGMAGIYYFDRDALDHLISKYQDMIDVNHQFEENTIAPEEVAGRYYYNQLSEEEQLVYKEILQGVREYQSEIQVHSADAEMVGTIYQKILYDSPELFWCDGSATTTTFLNYAIFAPNYTCTLEEKDARQTQIDTAVQECVAGVPAEGSTYEKIKYVYEYLVNQTDYQLDAPDSQNIYSVFANKVSVCAGYAKATQLLLQRIGIECIYVIGSTVETQAAHAWNIVNIDGDYYHVDTTWGDPVFVMQEEQLQNVSNMNYDYLCCDDEEVFKTHIVDEGISLPACTSKVYNYYMLNGCYYETYDADAILKAMNETIYAGGAQTIMKFANEEVYAQAKDAVLNDLVSRAMQNLMAAYGLNSVSCGQMVDDSTYKIIIYWNYTS